MSILNKKLTSMVAIASLAPVSAYAALPEGVKSAVENGFSDAKEVASMLVIGFAAIFSILLVLRLIKR